MNNQTQNDVEVSVITTTYNSLEYLPLSIESIQNQTFNNYEHIVVNDGSTDGTKDYLDSLKDQKIRVIHLERSGRGVALNKGLEESKGKYIAILDADDFSVNMRLEIQYATLREHPQYDLIASPFEIFSDQEDIDIDSKQNDAMVSSATERKLELKDFIYGNPICHSSVMMKKEFISHLGNYDQTRDELFDFDLWIRALISSNDSNMYNLEIPLIFRNLHDQQYFESRKRINYLLKTYALRRKLLENNDSPIYYKMVIFFVLIYGFLPRFFRKIFMN